MDLLKCTSAEIQIKSLISWPSLSCPKSCASCQHLNLITKWAFGLKTKTKRSNESTFFKNEAPEQQQPSGYQNSPQAIVWMRTMTQQEGGEQRSAELQARSPAGLDELARLFDQRTHTNTNTHTQTDG